MKFDVDIDNINYIKILYKDRYNFTHCTKAAIKRMDEKYIFADAKSDKPLNIETPQEIGLSFVLDNGIYKARTTLQYTSFDEEEEYFFFSLSTPKEVEYQQNREYFRVQLAEKVIVSYKSEDELVEIPAYTHDISANGVRITLQAPMKFPDEVTLELFLTSRTVKTSAKFVRTDEDDNMYKASFHFTNLATQDLDYISRMCLIKQIENKRKSVK